MTISTTEPDTRGIISRACDQIRRVFGLKEDDTQQTDLLPVFNAIIDNVRMHLVSAEAQMPLSKREHLRELQRQLDVARQSTPPDMPVILGIDAQLNALYPEEDAQARSWLIRDRFERVAASSAVQEWWLNAQLNEAQARLPPGSTEQVQRTNLPRARATARLLRDEAWQEARSARIAGDRAEADLQDSRQRFADRLSAETGAAQTNALRTSEIQPDASWSADLRAGLGAWAEAEKAVDAAKATREDSLRELSIARTQVQAFEALMARAAAADRLAATEASLEQVRARFHDTPEADATARAELETEMASLEDAVATAELEYDRLNLLADRLSRLAGIDTVESGAQSSSAATMSMLSYINSNFLMTFARESAERDLKNWLIGLFRRSVAYFLMLMAFTIVLHGIFWLCALLLQKWGAGGATECRPIGSLCDPIGTGTLIGPVMVLGLIALSGHNGALISIARRLQGVVDDKVLSQDPVLELTGLRLGRTGIRVAATSGTCFALLTYVLFASGIPATLGLATGLFPTARADESLQQDVLLASAAVGTAQRRVAELERRAASNDFGSAAPPASPPAPAAPDLPATDRPSTPEAADAPLTDVLPNTQPATAGAGETEVAELSEAREALAQAGSRYDNLLARDASRAANTASSRRTTPVLLGFNSWSDIWKLLLWAFIAGFAERFVPDTLDRLVSAGRGDSRKGARRQG